MAGSDDNAKEEHPCKYCEKKFSSREAYMAHLYSHIGSAKNPHMYFGIQTKR